MVCDCIIDVLLYYILPAVLAGLMFMKYKFSYWETRGVPANKPNPWNLLGDVWDVGQRVHFAEKAIEIYQQFKGKAPVCGMYMMTSPSLVTTDLELLRTIMVKDFNNFVDRGVYVNEVDDPLSGHLFSLDGEKWKRIRNNLSPTFTSGKIKQMYGIIFEKGEVFVKLLEKSAKSGQPVLTKDVNQRFTADIISSTAFGFETNALTDENSKVMEAAAKIFEPSQFLMIYFLFLSSFKKLSKFLHLRLFDKSAASFFYNTIKENFQYREKNNVERPDFFNMLVNLNKRGNINKTDPINEAGKLTFDEIAAQAFVFFFAGFETSSTAMQFALYLLGKHPDVQERLREEVQRVKAKHGGKIDYEALQEMTYLNQVFNETLRLYPPVPTLIRSATKDYKVPNSDIVIPKGVMITIPVIAIHRDPEYYPDPMKFDPDRFTPEEVAARHPYAFLPFGEGPRNCIGMRFAQVQSKFGLATIVDNFEVTVNSRTKEPIKLDKINPNVAVDGGIWVNLKKLNA